MKLTRLIDLCIIADDEIDLLYYITTLQIKLIYSTFKLHRIIFF